MEQLEETRVRCPRVGCRAALTFDGAEIERVEGRRYFRCEFMCWSCGANGSFSVKVTEADTLDAITNGQWRNEEDEPHLLTDEEAEEQGRTLSRLFGVPVLEPLRR